MTALGPDWQGRRTMGPSGQLYWQESGRSNEPGRLNVLKSGVFAWRKAYILWDAVVCVDRFHVRGKGRKKTN